MLRAVSVLAVALTVQGCETLTAGRLVGPDVGEAQPPRLPSARPAELQPALREPAPQAAMAAEDRRAGDFLRRGSDVFARPSVSPEVETSDAGEVTLNFENTNLLEVIKVILGDLLNENYMVEPGVQGSVTLNTSQPVTRERLLTTLEKLLAANGAALSYEDQLYRITLRENVLSGQAPSFDPDLLRDGAARLPPGYKVRVAPLKYVAAEEMQKILEPFAAPGNIVRVDASRNQLILAGTSQELEHLLETVRVFDVDWLEGMSVALFRPKFVEASVLAEGLDKLFGEQAEGSFKGLVRLVAMERINALLVVTPRGEYLDQVSEWVERLDRESVGSGRRLFVYRVQNGKAVDIADALGQVFTDGGGGVPRAELAPGLEPVRLSSPETKGQPGAATRQRATERERVRASASQGQGLTIDADADVKIIADEVNNALLVLATPEQYRQVLWALRQIDVVPMQVLIEATIAEITLTDDLRYGVRWFFKNHLDSKRGSAFLDLGPNVSLNSFADDIGVIDGFTYAVTDASGVVRALLNTLASESKLNILSSPSLMVLDNGTARIQVGDEVSIRTFQQATEAGNLNSSFERRDTGVILEVSPRVNASGLVTMEVSEEVSIVSSTDADGNPVIRERTINSTVAVQSGETVVLGGLIRDEGSIVKSGVPVLHTIPVIGALFGSTTDADLRTELVVLITPRAVRNVIEARQVTREFYEKMESLKPVSERRTVPAMDVPQAPEAAPEEEKSS